MVHESSSDLRAPNSDSAEAPVDLVARAKTMASVVEGDAEEAEARRTLQPKTVEAFRDEKLLRGFLPVELGGYECDLSVLVAVVAELSRQDGAAGWCFGMNGFITSFCAAHLADARTAVSYTHLTLPTKA